MFAVNLPQSSLGFEDFSEVPGGITVTDLWRWEEGSQQWVYVGSNIPVAVKVDDIIEINPDNEKGETTKEVTTLFIPWRSVGYAFLVVSVVVAATTASPLSPAILVAAFFMATRA